MKMIEVLKIKEIGKILQLTVSQLVYKNGVARGYIVEFTNGKYENPSLGLIYKESKALRVMPDELIIKEL